MGLSIGIDLGTSGIKAILVDEAETILAEAARPVAVSVPHVGWSEQDADSWVETVFACLDSIAADKPGLMAAVDGIGLSGQMLAALLLDADHKPVRPAMLWNDQRALAECEILAARCPEIGLKTNGAPDPGITAPKLIWLARHEPDVFARARMLLLTKDYVRLALTGELMSEPTDAGGTQLLDCRTGRWDSELCAAAGWNPDHLPPLVQSWEPAGNLRPALARRWGMRPSVVVAAGAGDNMGSTLGVGAARPGETVLTVGTSGVACIVDSAFHPGPSRAILTSAHAAPGTFLSMGVVMSATQSLDWTARLCGTDPARLAAEAERFAERGDLSAAPVFLPCLTGIRTPLNRPAQTGRIDGLHPGVDRGMLGYAVMEGIAFQFADCVAAQIDVGARPDQIAMVGGGTRSPLWTRLVATALGHTVSLPEGAHVSGPRGASRLAAVAAGQSVDWLARKLPVKAEIEPDPRLAVALAERRGRFDRLLA